MWGELVRSAVGPEEGFRQSIAFRCSSSSEVTGRLASVPGGLELDAVECRDLLRPGPRGRAGCALGQGPPARRSGVASA
eukprot:3212185-Pyramimonas_sp.AAC.1